MHASTLARAFADYADDVTRVIPSKGDVPDLAARYLAEVAKEKAAEAAHIAVVKRSEAARLESEGV